MAWDPQSECWAICECLCQWSVGQFPTEAEALQAVADSRCPGCRRLGDDRAETIEAETREEALDMVQSLLVAEAGRLH